MAFYSDTNLTEIFFLGNPPEVDGSFNGVSNATVYYLPQSAGMEFHIFGLPCDAFGIR